MKFTDAFPSKYIRSADLNGHDIAVVINNISFEKVGVDGDDPKPVISFQDRKKTMVLNKTNGPSPVQSRCYVR